MHLCLHTDIVGLNRYSAGIDFSRQDLTSIDVRSPHSKNQNISNDRRLMT